MEEWEMEEWENVTKVVKDVRDRAAKEIRTQIKKAPININVLLHICGFLD